MSLLMFTLQATGVTIFTDTLATSEGSAGMFTQKAWVLPQMKLTVAMTGISQVGLSWVETLYGGMLARDVEHLDTYTPECLRKIAQKTTDQFGPMPGTTTIYHFGQSESTDEYVGYAYRSTADYASERLPNTPFAVKPPPASGMPDPPPSNLAEFIAMAVIIKREQDDRDASERLYIGGDLVAISMEGGNWTIRCVYRFPDYEEDWNEMLDHSGLIDASAAPARRSEKESRSDADLASGG